MGKKNKMISAKQRYWLWSLALVRWDLRINVIMMVLKQCIAVSFMCSTQTVFKTNGVLCHIREVKSFILSVLIITSVASGRYFPTLLWSLLYFTSFIQHFFYNKCSIKCLPVRPTFFRHEKQRFFFLFLSEVWSPSDEACAASPTGSGENRTRRWHQTFDPICSDEIESIDRAAGIFDRCELKERLELQTCK